jgi:type II secretory pathway pseudopilin PulG
MKNQRGLILIELIAVIVLVGIIAAFTGFFLYTGMNGYLKTKNATEGALNAQMALDRITLELRNISYFTSATVPDTSLWYRSESEALPGARALKYASTDNTILISIDGTPYTLLENVSSFNLSVAPPKDLDNDGSSDDVAYIEVGFNINDVGKQFKTKIFPRNMVEHK